MATTAIASAPLSGKELTIPVHDADSLNHDGSHHSEDDEDDMKPTAQGADVEKAETHRSTYAELPVRRVTTAQDWEGNDDPENPHNWSTWRRAYHVIVPGCYGFVV